MHDKQLVELQVMQSEPKASVHIWHLPKIGVSVEIVDVLQETQPAGYWQLRHQSPQVLQSEIMWEVPVPLTT